MRKNRAAIIGGIGATVIVCPVNGEVQPAPLAFNQVNNTVVVGAYWKSKNSTYSNIGGAATLNLNSLDATGVIISTATATFGGLSNLSLTINLNKITNKFIYGFSWSITPNPSGDTTPDFLPDALVLYVVSYT